MSDNTETTQEDAGIRRAGTNGNLIPPVKGEIRNPAGKPKGTRNRSTIVREMLEVAAAEALKGKLDLGFQPSTIFEQLVAQQIVKASLGDTTAFRELADSAFGKLTEHVANTHTVNRMGEVTVLTADKTSGAQEAKALTFDIGEDVPITEEGEDDENYSG